MSKEKKAQIIDRLQEILSKCSVGILTDYRGLTVSEITGLRHRLRESDVEYRVVKNTLARFAAERANRADLVDFFVGPVAIAFGYDDIVEPAKVLTDYIRTSNLELPIKGGFLVDRLLTSEEVMAMSKLPSREVLLARVLGGMQSPITSLVYCLSAPITGFARVLQARINQLEGE